VVREFAASGRKFRNHAAFDKAVMQAAQADERDVNRVLRKLVFAGEFALENVVEPTK
jgi:hypothetical protein